MMTNQEISDTSVIYLHGFGSSPDSDKVSFFRGKFLEYGIQLVAPDLNVPTFSEMTITAMLTRIKDIFDLLESKNIILICSSLGTIPALNYLHKYPKDQDRVKKIILLSPSLKFIDTTLLGDNPSFFLNQWKKNEYAIFFHSKFKSDLPLSYSFISDLTKYKTEDIQLNTDFLIIHGKNDEVIDYTKSLEFADKQNNVIIELVDSDHRLTGIFESLWNVIQEFTELEYNHKIISMNLANEEKKEFEHYKKGFLETLRIAYGSSYFGDDFHLERLYSENCRVFIAFNKEDQILAVSYVQPNGKVTAIGVHEKYQRKGIAKKLILSFFKYYDYIFIETENQNMNKLLLSLGFSQINSIKKISELLLNKVGFINKISKFHTIVEYERAAPTLKSHIYKFKIFEKHGKPQ